MRILASAPLILWVVVRLYAYSDAGVGIPAFLFGTLAGAALFLWYVSRLGAALVSAYRRRTLQLHFSWMPYLGAPALILLVFALTITSTAFRVRFFLSSGALERYASVTAQRVEPGVEPWSSFQPVRVGLFRIRETEVLPNGVVRLITTSCMLDDCGYAYSPAGVPTRIGEDFYRPLSRNWWHWQRSW